MPGILQQKNEIEELKNEYQRLADCAFKPKTDKKPALETLVLEEC